MSNTSLWKWCRIGMGILVILTFTPLVTPAGVYEPMLFNMPYTLWAGILLAILMVLVTYLGTRVHPGRNE